MQIDCGVLFQRVQFSAILLGEFAKKENIGCTNLNVAATKHNVSNDGSYIHDIYSLS